MPRPIHFEIHAADPARAQRFYTGLFAWKFEAWGPPGMYWIVKTGDGPGIDGGMVQRKGPAPAADAPVSAFVCTVDVASVDDSAKKVLALGGSVALPKMPIPGVGWLCYVKDTEGNLLGMMTADSSAR